MGKLVISTNASGAVLFKSVAQSHAIGELSVTPKVGSAAAEAGRVNVDMQSALIVDAAGVLAVVDLATARGEL